MEVCLLADSVGSSYGTISASYATGNADGDAYVGGLVGWNFFGTISGSYATGAATSTAGSFVGGLVGNNNGTISASYATGDAISTSGSFVGGLVGRNGGTIGACYFDSNVSNRPATDPHSKTTSELQSPTGYTGIYADWNVDVDDGLAIGVDDATMPGDATPDEPWDFGTNSEYPVLKYIDANGDGTIDDRDLARQRAALPVLPSAPSGVAVEAVTETSVSAQLGCLHRRYGL